MGRHAALRGRFIESKDGIGRAARFEGSHLLKIFAFKEERRTGGRIEARAGQDRRPMDVRTNAFVRGENGGVIERHRLLLNARRIFLSQKCPYRKSMLDRLQIAEESAEALGENVAANFQIMSDPR